MKYSIHFGYAYADGVRFGEWKQNATRNELDLILRMLSPEDYSNWSGRASTLRRGGYAVIQFQQGDLIRAIKITRV